MSPASRLPNLLKNGFPSAGARSPRRFGRWRPTDRPETPMPLDVTLPQLGESTFEGTIGKWLKRPGDRVERFEPLVEIITDKVNVEMPAPYGGVLARILIPEGQTVPVAPRQHPGDQLVKLTPLRRSIAQRMAQSKREIPHAYGVIEVDMTALVRWREAHKDAWRSREGVNLTYTAFFVRAAADALRAFPLVNSSWSEDGIILRGVIAIGIGIALDDGLIVAVIKHADQKPLVGIAKELETLGRKAREGTLTLDDVSGGTFTLTNPGVFGSIWSMPIIIPGQAAILATDAIVKRPVARNDAIVLRDIMHLGLSFDHRIFDGAVADGFLTRIRQRLERTPGGAAAPNDF